MSPLDGRTRGTKMAFHLVYLKTSIQSALLGQQIGEHINAKQQEAWINPSALTSVRIYTLKLKVRFFFTSWMSFPVVFLQCVSGNLWCYYLAAQMFSEPCNYNNCWYHKIHANTFLLCALWESLSFNCKVELSSGWEYFWYKDKMPLNISSSSFNIDHADLSHSGIYECMARRTNTMYTTEHSDGRTLRITGEPKNITLCCDVCYLEE